MRGLQILSIVFEELLQMCLMIVVIVKLSIIVHWLM